MNSVYREELNKLYWDDFLSLRDLAKKYSVSHKTIQRWMLQHKIPRRGCEKNGKLKRYLHEVRPGYFRWDIYFKGKKMSEHRHIIEKEVLGRHLKSSEFIHHKDGCSLNNHTLNLQIVSNLENKLLHKEGLPNRPTWFKNHMEYAHTIAGTSSCDRRHVGCVITNYNLDQVYAFGINGNAKGLHNGCDSEEPGACGCTHAEPNALIKVGVRDPNKVMFCTLSPCLACAKLIINSGFSWVYYGESYRDTTPLSLLHYSGIKTCPYPVVARL